MFRALKNLFRRVKGDKALTVPLSPIYEAIKVFSKSGATPDQWVEFCTEVVREAYLKGIVEGFEAREYEDPAPTKLPPELMADEVDPSWRDRPMQDLGDLGIPEAEELDPGQGGLPQDDTE